MIPDQDSTEEINLSDPAKALGEIKDTAILLWLASEYLCEEAFLKKTGYVLLHNLEIVEKHIEKLKSQFVGRPLKEIDLTQQLNAISQLADLVQEADDGIKHRCVSGELGLELKEKLETLTSAIESLEERAEGRSVSYTTTDSVMGVMGKFKIVTSFLVATYKFTAKIVGILFLIALSTFAYLYFTMEKEADILAEIEQANTLIRENRETFADLDVQLKEMKAKIQGMEKNKKTLTRQEEVELMDLNLKAYKLEDMREQARIKTDIYEKEAQENLRRLEQLRGKSFSQRLLRQ
jgi:hypothetical protein